VHSVDGQRLGQPSFERLVAELSSQPDFELVEVERPSAASVAVLVTKRAGTETLEAIRHRRAQAPHAAIVLVLERSGNGDVAKAVAAGANGILSADRIEEAAAATVRAAVSGQLVIPGESPQDVRHRALTMREKQILRLVVIGLTNGQIASKLFLAESTVKSHLSSAFTKLRVSSRNEAVTLILDPERGRSLGILGIPSRRTARPTERLATR
jgi:DNA-binding NarL/FixJ family response regulator